MVNSTISEIILQKIENKGLGQVLILYGNKKNVDQRRKRSSGILRIFTVAFLLFLAHAGL